MSDELTIRNLRSVSEVHAAHLLEANGYPSDEAASLETMLYRYTNAPYLFLGAFTPEREIAGYIMSTQSADTLVTHASMETHDPEGHTVCVHSVCVAPEHRGKGVALRLLKEYTEMVRKYNEEGSRKINRLAMMSRQNLVPLYERAGYRVLGPSKVIHGAEKWYDCVLDL